MMANSLVDSDKRPSSSDHRWITTTVALAALMVFVISGSQTIPILMDAALYGSAVDSGRVGAFLLNIALVLFAWRRSTKLMLTARERDAAKSHIEDLAFRDEVTGLANRRRLNEVLEQLCAEQVGHTALLLIDLDHFKKINDLHGHAAGDELLAGVASRLLSATPSDAICFRQGGDEFAVVLRGKSAQIGQAEKIASLIQAEIAKPFVIKSATTGIGSSIGIASLTTHRLSPRGLLKHADLALYEAKRQGRNRAISFSGAMARELDKRARLEADMSHGIESGEFVPYFQPIIDLEHEELRGFEVLARWQHPQRGLILPPDFMRLAEETGMVADLSFSVMQQALLKARAWPSNLVLAVNVSPAQFNDPLLAQRILRLLSLTGYPPGRLEIEIMERCLLDDQSSTLATIESLRNVGVRVSIGDFGTGYAALTSLKVVPFDRIKINRRFMHALAKDQLSNALVQAVSSLGKGLKLPMTAEGVESEAVRSKLSALGCTDAQGWLFAEALSADDVARRFVTTAPREASSTNTPG